MELSGNKRVVLSSEIRRQQVVYENKYQRVYRVEVAIGEFAKEYFVTDYGQRAGLLVVRGEEILLVRQYRMLLDGLSWEIPGGKVDEGETPEAAAMRECLEETGVCCRNLHPLVYFHPGLDTNHNPTYMFYTEEFVEQRMESLKHREVYDHFWISLPRCLGMVQLGEIMDSLSIIAILSYYALQGRR